MLTFAFLGVLAICFTVISLRWYNLLLSFVAALWWFSLWAYFATASPLTGVTHGTFIGDCIYYGLLLMALLCILIYFRGRGQAKGSFNANTSLEGVDKPKDIMPESRGLMNLNDTEYRTWLRNRRKSRR